MYKIKIEDLKHDPESDDKILITLPQVGEIPIKMVDREKNIQKQIKNYTCDFLRSYDDDDDPVILMSAGIMGSYVCGDAIITMHSMGYDLTNNADLKKAKKSDKKRIKNHYKKLLKEKPELFGLEKTVEEVELESQEIVEKTVDKETALKKLKDAKEQLDLEIINQQEYDKLKEELKPIITNDMEKPKPKMVNEQNEKYTDQNEDDNEDDNEGGAIQAILGVAAIGALIFWVFSPSIEDKLEDAIAPTLRNPSSLQIINYGGPYEGSFMTPMGGGKGYPTDLSSGCSKIESYYANVTGSNAFGGTVQQIYIVFFKDGDVCGTYTTQGGTMMIPDKVSRDCGCG